MTRRQSILSILLFGLVCASLLWDSLVTGTSIAIGNLIIPLAVLVVAVLWRRFEVKSHKHHLDHWQVLRSRGKYRFIFVRYILVRGGAVLVLLLVPIFFTLKMTGSVLLVVLLTMAPALLTLFFMGYQEWKTCESEFEILALRYAAEQSRKLSTRVN